MLHKIITLIKRTPSPHTPGTTRTKTMSDACPYCDNEVTVFDDEEDCCVTCCRSWTIETA